ncbi:MAG: asparagine synthase B [Roseiflexus sp.]
MCGIAGAYRVTDTARIEQMLARLTHRGPDGQGVVVTDTGVLGHTRLAIIDLEGGRQPMEHAGAVICFNGEIYNYRSLRNRYLRDQTLETDSDTEVLVRLYRTLGPGFVNLLEGMFAFAILDGNDLFLARDPIGIKPLYLAQHDHTLLFASEIKALAPYADQVTTFPPGTWYHSRLGSHTYYEFAQGWPRNGIFETAEQAQTAIRAVLRSAVHKRLLADVPVGISLSGGLDSSIIALLARAELDYVETFAVGMEGSEDLEAARHMAEYLGTRHYEYVYTLAEMEAVLPEVIYHLESADPALVRSAVPNYFLARLASERVKVILTGEGADELYAGYDYMRALTTPEDLHHEMEIAIRELHRTNLQRADRMFMAFGVEGRVPFLDIESIALALSLPPEWKLAAPGESTKMLLRQAFANDLPDSIVQRPKQKFSAGAGSMYELAKVAEARFDDRTLARERRRLMQRWNYRLLNKEAIYYLDTLRTMLPEHLIIPEMGMSRSL